MGTLRARTTKIPRGETMSSFNSGCARKRLSLFAGGSLAAMSILGVSGGVLLAPGVALAANECGDPAANAATADTFACTGTYASIVYPSTNGNLTLTLTNGPTVTTGGISVTGTGANTVTINRSDATAGAGDPSITNTSGAGIQATTGTGQLFLTLTDGDVSGGDAPLAITGTTAGVQLQSGGTTGQALNLTFTSGAITATGANGVGVAATTTSVGAGNLVLSLGGAVSGASGVRATTNGTGALQIQIPAVSATVLGGDVVGLNGAALQLSPNALGNVLIGAGRTVRATNSSGGVIEFTNINATRTATVNNSGTIRSNDDTEAGYDDLVVLVSAGDGNSNISSSATSAIIQGRVSLLNTGAATVNIGQGVWRTAGVNTIGAGSSSGSLLSSSGNNGANAGIIGTNASGAATSFAFGDGDDLFNMGGTLAVGEGEEAAATLQITGLEIWDNAGRVLFGVDPDLFVGPDRPIASDGVTNDRIVAQGAAFNGTTISSPNLSSFNSSIFVMDVDFAADQLDCSAAVTADCLDLRGGSAAGATPVEVNVVGGGFAERLVLVDVAGAGTSTADAFTLDPLSDGYREVNGAGAIDSGFFLYTLQFDETAEQYALVASEFGARGLAVGGFSRAATEPWRTATGTWHDRQVDLRDALADGEATGGPAVWVRLAGNFIDESGFRTSDAGVEYDISADQRTTALVGGVDLMRAASDNTALVVGLTAGKLDSTADFTTAGSELEMEGHSFGAYASFLTGRLFLDGIVNRTSLDLTLEDMGQAFETSATSTGYQVEGGYRLFQLGDGGVQIEPLAALSYVTTDMDDLAIGPATARFDAKSLRGALGLRFAGDIALEALTAKFSFTGRLWEEFEGENETTLTAAFADAAIVDEAPGSLADLGVALGLFTLGDRLSANIGYGVKFAEDYQSTDASISFRLSW